MFRRTVLSLALASLAGLTLATSASAGWDTFVIRNATTNGNAPAITANGDGSYTFGIFEGGQKAGWGTNDVNGMKIGDIAGLGITRSDPRSPVNAPYINFLITNGAGEYAIIAGTPTAADGHTWSRDQFLAATADVYESSNSTWLKNLNAGGTHHTFADFAQWVIQAPTAAEFGSAWDASNVMGTGAPRDILNGNKAYGVNWVFGDTLSNYTTTEPGYVCANPCVKVVPEPMFFQMGSLLALGGLGLLKGRKR